MENTLLLRHSTYLEALYNILKTGTLLSPSSLGITGSGYDQDTIFFTPLTYEYINNDIDKSYSLYLDLDKTISKYDRFFINSGNSFLPLHGKPNKKGNCKCLETYHNNLDSNKYPDPISQPCYKSYNDFIELIRSLPQNEKLFDYCDGGIEFGFITPNIKLDQILKYVIIPNRKDVNKNTQNIDELYNEIESMVEKFGGVFIEKPHLKIQNKLGGKTKTKKNRKKINKIKNIYKKTKSLKNKK